MTAARTAALISGLLVFGAAVAASPQEEVAEETAGAVEIPMPHGKPQNIKVLSKDLSATELGRIMKRFETDLGVKCGHCHVEDPGTRKFDFVSDENPTKSTARLMITMLKDINEKYLPQLRADSRYASHVTCGSCHQGQSNPPAVD